MERSKADGIGKILICFQAVWIVAQCIGRSASHLPLALLEINTLDHVLCALSLYIIWYHKPQDMNDPINLKAMGSNLDRFAKASESHLSAVDEVPNFSVDAFSERFTIQRHLVLCLASSAFGALHLTAWHSTFPSLIEKLLWRSSAICITSSGVLAACILALTHLLPIAWRSDILTCIITLSMHLCVPVLYVGSRAFLLLEAFISLRALPVQAYQTPNWTLSIPHF